MQTRQSQRLGQWMDWERSYYTMTDTNIEYIWGFLQEGLEGGGTGTPAWRAEARRQGNERGRLQTHPSRGTGGSAAGTWGSHL